VGGSIAISHEIDGQFFFAATRPNWQMQREPQPGQWRPPCGNYILQQYPWACPLLYDVSVCAAKRHMTAIP
jgi:hypothetical protein